MKPGLIYRLQFENICGRLVTTEIADTEVLIADDADADFIDLDPGGDPCRLRTADDNEDKFTPIKAKQLITQFLSTSDYDMSTFADGPDDRFRVTTKVDSQIVFEGFLAMDEFREAFLPKRNVIALMATDKLGALKDIAWTDNDGINPIGKYRIADIISQCLKKTGLSLPINVINNLRHGSGQLSTAATFSEPGNYFVTDGLLTTFFYVGMELEITGTSDNNRTAVVTAVDNTGLVSQVTLDEAIAVSESAAGAVFTDVSSKNQFYDNVFLDAKTFEDKIGSCINCYDVLSRILGEDAVITQWKGQWWIFRIDEIDDNPLYVAEFDEDGEFIQFNSPTQFDRSIGFDEDIWFSNEETEVLPERPHGFVKETFKYQTPREIICNIDFDRGEFIEDLPDVVEEDVTYQAKSYQTECWDLRRRTGSITSTTFIKKLFAGGVEKERFVVITPADDPATPWDFIQSQPIEVTKNDKGTVSIDFRLASDIDGGGMTYFPLMIYLKANNGDYYYWWKSGSLDREEFYWTGPESAEQDRYIPDQFIADNIDLTEWTNISVTLRPFPADGKLYVCLLQMNQEATSDDNVDVHYQNLNFSYEAYINGSYIPYSGQYNRVDRTDVQDSGEITTRKYLAKRDERVYVSDSPKPLFKGSMFLLIDGEHVLTSRFFNAAPFGGYPPGPEYTHPYGYIQAFSVWNQYRNPNSIFQFSIKGDKDLDGFGDLPPDLLERYFISDTTMMSMNRKFMMLTFDHDLFLNESKGTLVEVHRADGKLYGDVFTFKYDSPE